MITPEIKTARRARTARIEAALKAWQAAHPPSPGYKPLSPEERAKLIAAENAKPIPQGCCGQ